MAAELVDLDTDGDDTPDLVAGGSGLSRLRPFVTTALSAPVGTELMSQVVSLMGKNLTAREWLEVTAACKQLIGFATAAQLTAIGELDRLLNPSLVESDQVESGERPRNTCPVRRTADELAPVLGIAPRAASALVALNRRVDDGLPAAADALADGRMDLTQLKILDAVVRDLPTASMAAVEAAAVRWAPRRTAQQLRHDLETEAQRLDPEHAARAAERGVAERDVSLRPSPLPGCKRLVADLPLVDGTAAWLAVNGAACRAKDRGRREDGAMEIRTRAQLRADALVALVTGQADTNTCLVPSRDELALLAEVQVVVAADTLLGTTDLPAHVPAVGPLDASSARRLAARTRWRRLVADSESGTLRHVDGATTGDPRWEKVLGAPVVPARLDHGTTRYVPPAPLRLHVQTRDATCIGPACHHPARRTQLDHTVNFGERDDHGVLGTTSDINLGSTCVRIHNAKTHGGWRLAQTSRGNFTWTSPTGRRYGVHARPLVPGWHTLRRTSHPPSQGM